jgi:RNA polymerase sigma-70 factor, ECF subfamily
MSKVTTDPGAQLMLAYQAGDESAFDQLVERYSGRIFALITRFMGAGSGREDLLQEVFLRVIRARDRYRPDARLSTWLYRITFNLCVNEGQRRRNKAALSLDKDRSEDGTALLDREDAGVPTPSSELERAEAVKAVRQAIAGLPDQQRMALILAKYEDLPYAEVAVALDSTEKAVKSMIHRAREKLRATLAPFLQEEFA